MTPYILRFLQDMHTALYIIGGIGIGGSALLGLLLLVLLRYQRCIAPIFCFSAVTVPLALSGGGVLLWFLTYDYELEPTGLHSPAEILCVRILGYVLWALAGLSLALVAFRRRVFAVDVSVTKAAARCVREVRWSLVFPLVMLAGHVLFLGAVGTWFLFLSTVGGFEEEVFDVFGSGVAVKVWRYSSRTHYAFWFLFIVFFWTAEFILALGQLTLSLSFSQWYFTAEKDEGNTVSILRCTGTTLLRHAGTAAFGSIIIKPLTVLRAPALFLQNRIRRTRHDNRCLDAIICSCQCCFFFLERYGKFVDRASYVQTALFGSSFTKGSQESYFLLGRNAGRTSSGRGLGAGRLSFFFVKVFISVVTAGAAFLACGFFYGGEVRSVVLVTAVVGVVAWFVGQMFVEVMNMAVSTIIQCFLADEEMFGNEGSLYVPDELDEFLAQLDGGGDGTTASKSEKGGEGADGDGWMIAGGKDRQSIESPVHSSTSVDEKSK